MQISSLDGNTDLVRELYEVEQKHGSPLSVHWEITDACNLSCIHCYLPKVRSFVTLSRARMLIDAFERHGVLTVSLSGGEALLHPDFVSIYTELKRRGFLVSVFTNGTLIKEAHLDLFTEYPPNGLYISIYGIDESTYGRTTQRGSFGTFTSALGALAGRGIPFILQTPIMQSNLTYLAELDLYCKSWGVPYRFGQVIYCQIDGCKGNLHQRIDPRTLVERLSRFPEIMDTWASQSKETIAVDRLRCGAAKNYIAIDAQCRVNLCGLLRQPSFEFSDAETFATAINKAIAFRDMLDDRFSDGSCGKCSLLNLCHGCPALSWLENADYTSCAQYFHDVAVEKRAALRNQYPTPP